MVIPRSFWWASTASSSPRTSPAGTVIATNRNVVFRLPRNSGVARRQPGEGRGAVEPEPDVLGERVEHERAEDQHRWRHQGIAQERLAALPPTLGGVHRPRRGGRAGPDGAAHGPILAPVARSK